MTRHRKYQQPMMGVRVGANEAGFVSSEQVHLVVSLTADNAALSGPATHDMEWVTHALSGLADQWVHQQPMPHVDPPDKEPEGQWMDCTQTDCTVVFYRECQVISMPGEVFGDGLAQYTLDIVGQRRHDDDYCTDRLRALAEAVAQDIEEGNIPARESSDE